MTSSGAEAAAALRREAEDHLARGALDVATDLFDRAARAAPSDPHAALDLAGALLRAGRLTAAIRTLRTFLGRAPDHPAAWVALASLHQASGEVDAAVADLAAARRLRPDDDGLRLIESVLRLRVVYRDGAEVDAARSAYAAGIASVAAEIRLDTPARIEAAVSALGERLPYYLPYQGRNDRDLQAVHGGLAHRIMAARHPEWSAAPRPGGPDDRIRVGFLSGYFRRHSNWWMPIRGWIEGLDPRRFAIFGYCLNSHRDEITAAAEARCVSFRQGLSGIEAWASAIRADRLHALIMPEVGMDPTCFRLAALRLAPYQAASWGHPQTTGLPTIDAFLSSDAMEPPDGDGHYTERLVRLPGISVALAERPVGALPAFGRDDLGAGQGATIYWCCQNLSKYLPAYDDVFPRIAAAVPDAVFVFIGHHLGRRTTGIVRDRLTGAFARHGLSAERHCRFMRSMSPETFTAVTRTVDVFLDSIGWSGCNTVLEAIAAGVPIVTLRGDMMRGRHAAAFLGKMGMPDLIAENVDAYVAQAVELGRDRDRRRDVAAEMSRRRGSLYDDHSPVHALARHLESVAAAAERS